MASPLYGISDVVEHFRVFREDVYLVVRVDDYELFDWLDDILSDEHDLEVGLSRQPDGGPYDLLLPSDIPIERIEAIVADLDGNEVERVWKLNNPKRWFRKRRITRP